MLNANQLTSFLLESFNCRIPSLHLLVGFAELDMVKKLHAQAAW